MQVGDVHMNAVCIYEENQCFGLNDILFCIVFFFFKVLEMT